MIPRARVMLMIPRILKDLDGKEGVRFIGRSTQIECKLNRELEDGLRTVYSIEPLTNPPGKCYYEIQTEEGWEPNTGQVVTNMSGKKLNPRWGGWKKPDLHRAGFRSSKELVEVKAYMIRSFGTFTRLMITQEGREKLLVVEVIGQFTFSVEKNEIATEKDEHENMINAAKAAISRAICNCTKKGCASHYAMTKEEAEVWEKARRERQKAKAEAAKSAGETAEETPEAPLSEEAEEAEEAAAETITMEKIPTVQVAENAVEPPVSVEMSAVLDAPPAIKPTRTKGSKKSKKN